MIRVSPCWFSSPALKASLNYPDIFPFLDLGTELSSRSSGRQNNSVSFWLVSPRSSCCWREMTNKARDVWGRYNERKEGRGWRSWERLCWIQLSHHPKELNVRNERLCIWEKRWQWRWRHAVLESFGSIMEEFGETTLELWNGFFLKSRSVRSQKLRLLAQAGNPSWEAHILLFLGRLWCGSTIFHALISALGLTRVAPILGFPFCVVL